MGVREGVVLDASAAMRLASADRFDLLAGFALCAPHLVLSEVRSSLFRSAARGHATVGDARAAFDRLRFAPVEILGDLVSPSDRDIDAPWELASRLGWRKTYDAEYLALAVGMGRRLATFDKEMAEGARELGVLLVDFGAM